MEGAIVEVGKAVAIVVAALGGERVVQKVARAVQARRAPARRPESCDLEDAIREHMRRDHAPAAQELTRWRSGVDDRLNRGATTIHGHETRIALLEREVAANKEAQLEQKAKLGSIEAHLIDIRIRLGIPVQTAGS